MACQINSYIVGPDGTIKNAVLSFGEDEAEAEANYKAFLLQSEYVRLADEAGKVLEEAEDIRELPDPADFEDEEEEEGEEDDDGEEDEDLEE